MKQYETVIGLEVHVELATKTKIFCGCSTAFGAPPNAHICPVCLGMPGTLPVLNKQVLEYAIAVGMAMNCEISRFSRFDRKNYFYPDNPQNYQISQLYYPICRNGHIDITTENGRKRIGITQIHMEEDAGKLIHREKEEITLVDYNRAGVPLIEIVSEPDFRDAKEVIAYLEELRMLITYIGASDCKLQEGSMRADINLSVREAGTAALGTRTEMKNLSSFHAITKAIEVERARQIELLEAGGCIWQETRRFDEEKEQSCSMRSKEEACDYRYFPEPDVPPIVLEDHQLEAIRRTLPEFREEKKKRYREQLSLPEYDIDILTADKALADYFEQIVAAGAPAKKASNWLMGEVLRFMKDYAVDAGKLVAAPEHLAELILMVEHKEITGTVAKELLTKLLQMDFAPGQFVKEHGLGVVVDERQIEEEIRKVIALNPKSVEDYRNGKTKAIGYLVGQTMKAMQGKADAESIREKIERLL